LNISFCLLLIVVVICCNFIIFLRCSMYKLLYATKSFQYLTYISILINDNSCSILIFANVKNEEQNRNLYIANLYFFASIIVTLTILFFFNVTRLLALYCYYIRYTFFKHNYFDDLCMQFKCTIDIINKFFNNVNLKSMYNLLSFKSSRK